MGRIRAFVAAEMPEEVLENISAAVKDLESAGEGIRCVDPANMHLTIKFLGEIPESDAMNACRICTAAAGQSSPVTAAVGGVGAFPGPRRPRVIWAGVEEDTGGLARIYGALDTGMEEIGVAPERRPFRPHLTLARVRFVRDRGPLDNFLISWADREFGEAHVGEICLFMSELRKSGPLYTKMGTFPLSPGL